MIGNDIVDLTFAKKESNWKRPRFLDKLFTQKEQSIILKSEQPDKMVWLLWSMKESAYKLHVQLFGKRFFRPKRFECTVFDLTEKKCIGEVYYTEFQCFTKSTISDDFVSTIAKLDQNKDHFGEVFLINNSNYKTQHSVVYKEAKTQFAALKETAVHEIRIQKNDTGVPFLYNKKQKEKVAVSIAHHGNYGAFAFTKC